LTEKREKKAALRYFKKGIRRIDEPTLVNIDKSGANTAAINQYNTDAGSRVEIRQCKYLNNIVEQVMRHTDHRFIKRITRSMLGFKNFFAAQRTLAGIELMRMLKKGQMKWQSQHGRSPAELFYALAG